MKLELNTANGDVMIGDVKITPMFTIAAIEALKATYEIIFIYTTGTGFTYYRSSFLNGGENAVLFAFSNDKIHKLNIGAGLNYNFPPFEITEEEKMIAKDIVKKIGGEHKYSWGEVFYNEDYKGGNVNVGIKYNNGL